MNHYRILSIITKKYFRNMNLNIQNMTKEIYKKKFKSSFEFLMTIYKILKTLRVIEQYNLIYFQKLQVLKIKC